MLSNILKDRLYIYIYIYPGRHGLYMAIKILIRGIPPDLPPGGAAARSGDGGSGPGGRGSEREGGARRRRPTPFDYKMAPISVTDCRFDV